MTSKRVFVTLSSGQSVPRFCSLICNMRFLLILLAVAAAALKELESDKGIIIRYVIGRRFVSIFLSSDHINRNKIFFDLISLYIPDLLPLISSTQILLS